MMSSAVYIFNNDNVGKTELIQNKAMLLFKKRVKYLLHSKTHLDIPQCQCFQIIWIDLSSASSHFRYHLPYIGRTQKLQPLYRGAFWHCCKSPKLGMTAEFLTLRTIKFKAERILGKMVKNAILCNKMSIPGWPPSF